MNIIKPSKFLIRYLQDSPVYKKTKKKKKKSSTNVKTMKCI